MESISRISSLLETARDLTLDAAREASAGTRKPSRPLPAAQIKKLLDSRHEREVLDGLRRVISMQYTHPPQPTLPFFPFVLKTLSNPYPSTRPLVYNYLIHHAEADPDTALLAINTIQKSLSDTNPRVRAMALKTMSAIRVPVISQIVSLAIKKGTSDLSPLVRKAAALACVKCVRLDPSTRPQVEEYLSVLLADKQYYVAGAAVQAFMEVCAEKLELIHPVYRRLCGMVVDMDEWGQLALLKLFTVYARKCFPRRTKRVRRTTTQEEKAKDFYEDLSPQNSNENENEEEAIYDDIPIPDPDLTLFLDSTKPLLQSRNSAVILAVTRAYLYLSPTTYLPFSIPPLIALLRSPKDIQEVALHNIVQICLYNPQIFLPYTRHFLLSASEPPQIWTLKLEVLTLLFPHSSQDMQSLILAELEHFSHSHNPLLVRESVRAIGRCAASPQASPSTRRKCLQLLLKQIHSSDQNLVGEAIEVVRHLIQRNPEEHRRTTVIRLAKNLDTLTSGTARASIIWLVGEYAAGEGEEEGIAADVLRILVKGYADESDEVRAQIILLAAKVCLHYLNSENAKKKAATMEELDPPSQPPQLISPTDDSDGFRDPTTPPPEQEAKPPHPIELLYTHTLLLAHYTPSYSLRDRARLYRALLSNPQNTDLASLLLLAPKPVPQAPSPSESRKDFVLGSANLVVGEAMRGEGWIPDWVKEGEEPDPKLRDEGPGEGKQGEYVPIAARGGVSAGQRLDEALRADSRVGRGGVEAGGGRREKTLDDWLNDDEEESESGSESGETATEEEESEEEEEEEEEESESEEDEKAGLVR